jgi:ATP synthase protein I
MKKNPEDINELEKRIAAFNEENGAIKKSAPLTNSKLVAKAFVLGTEFVGAVLVGIGLGFFLDTIFKSKVVFTIIFALFGCVAGVMNMYRSAQKMEKDLD